jgi:hypothetical protein
MVESAISKEDGNKTKTHQIVGYLTMNQALIQSQDDIVRYNNLLYKRHEMVDMANNMLELASQKV